MLVSIREQLKDPIYRKWMAKKPRLRVVGNNEPWWIIVQKAEEGGWGRKKFYTYAEAYDFLRTHLRDFYDLTLHCPRQEFQPPVVIGKKGKPVYHLPELPVDTTSPHFWCSFCRRMSIFRPFARHHNLPGIRLQPDDRCIICGARKSFIRRYR